MILWWIAVPTTNWWIGTVGGGGPSRVILPTDPNDNPLVLPSQAGGSIEAGIFSICAYGFSGAPGTESLGCGSYDFSLCPWRTIEGSLRASRILSIFTGCMLSIAVIISPLLCLPHWVPRGTGAALAVVLHTSSFGLGLATVITMGVNFWTRDINCDNRSRDNIQSWIAEEISYPYFATPVNGSAELPIGAAMYFPFRGLHHNMGYSFWIAIAAITISVLCIAASVHVLLCGAEVRPSSHLARVLKEPRNRTTVTAVAAQAERRGAEPQPALIAPIMCGDSCTDVTVTDCGRLDLVAVPGRLLEVERMNGYRDSARRERRRRR